MNNTKEETTVLPTLNQTNNKNEDDVDITSVKSSSNSCSINITENSTAENEKSKEKKLVLDPNYVKHKLPKVKIILLTI